ncbi:MAG: metallophosphoesterase [Bacilli bacterium]|nr:metallophosphoesterase [Bacilli bacterium]
MKNKVLDKSLENKIQLVKKLVLENTVIPEFYYKTGLSEEQVTQIFHALRRQGFRVFVGLNQDHESFCTFAKYKSLQGYSDIIKTHASSLGVAICADLHLGSFDDNINYVNGMINYCIKNNISNIIILGDLIEGTEYFKCHNNSGLLRIEADIYKQLEYVNEVLPKVPGITYHMLYGNHDLFSESGISYDIIKDLIEVYGRNDFKVIGCEHGKLQINRDHFKFIHSCMSGLNQTRNKHKQNLSFYGGGHRSEYITDLKEVSFYKSVPPLSNKKSNKPLKNGIMVFPGFIDFRLVFASDGTVQDLYINDMAFVNSSNMSYCQCFDSKPIYNYRARK